MNGGREHPILLLRRVHERAPYLSKGFIYAEAGVLGFDNFVSGGAWPQHSKIKPGPGHENEGEN